MTATPDMPITAIAPWFGGKRNLAPRIVAELGEHRAYWEPFCGSMAVLLAKPAATMETVNDLHGDLINLARVLQCPTLGPALYRRLRRTLMHESVFEDADAWLREHDRDKIDIPDLDRAERYFITSWLGRNGTAGTPVTHKGTYCVRFTRNGGHAAKRFRSAIESIPTWRRRLREITILRRDGIELLGRIEDDAKTAIYVDPPYVVKGAKYQHDFDGIDHHRLAKTVARFQRARVVVSYYPHPMLDALYPGWTRVGISVSRAMAHQVKRGPNGARATELLLINGPSYTDPGSEDGTP